PQADERDSCQHAIALGTLHHPFSCVQQQTAPAHYVASQNLIAGHDKQNCHGVYYCSDAPTRKLDTCNHHPSADVPV
ncbi:hypothetical protein A2U01_0083353, partial [Trifolium medium]|nr:hypothetical protein [Trifolium medium]